MVRLTRVGADANAALSRIGCGGDLNEYSYDVIASEAALDLTPAPKRLVMVADEQGQTMSGLDESATLEAMPLDARVLTFTDVPTDYDALGPTERVDHGDVTGRVRDFLLTP